MRLVLAVLGAGLALAFVACASNDLVIGDDTQATEASDSSSPMTSGGPDSTPPVANDAAPDVVIPDAAPKPACATGGGTCLAQGTKCQGTNPNATCPNATEFCCQQTCPMLSPPAPGFCDGGPIAPKYDTFGCTIGYACAPITCAEGGGQCVGLAPTACPAPKKFGDAAKYSCGGGIGTACCLP